MPLLRSVAWANAPISAHHYRAARNDWRNRNCGKAGLNSRKPAEFRYLQSEGDNGAQADHDRDVQILNLLALTRAERVDGQSHNSRATCARQSSKKDSAERISPSALFFNLSRL